MDCLADAKRLATELEIKILKRQLSRVQGQQ